MRWSHEPARAADLPAAFARAYSRACQPPPGPAFLSIPVDGWDARAEPVRAPARPREFGSHPEDVAELADALAFSTAPALVVGSAVGASGSVPDVVTLGGLDFISLAAAMGRPAQRVVRPEELAPALREAAGRPGPSLLHVAVAADAAALY